MKFKLKFKNKTYQALIDSEDSHLLKKYKYRIHPNSKTNSSYYIVRSERVFVGRSGWRVRFLHRDIINPQKKQQIDHINGNGLDNRRKNLRICCQSKNHRNEQKRSHHRGRACTSKYKGVSAHGQLLGRWVARIMYPKGTRIYLGLFKSQIEAAKAYDKAALNHFGEFARLNFPKNKEK